MDSSALIRLIAGEPEMHKTYVKQGGIGKTATIRVRPMWQNWEADVFIKFDPDLMTPAQILNLLDRAGHQVGIGEGRPFSTNSVGQGWGTFMVLEQNETETA